MLYSALVNSNDELHQILHLQQLYLRGNNNEQEEKEQGFVTVHHSFDVLNKMHQLSPSIIIKDDDKVVAYALTMVNECRHLIPVLLPMFEMLDKIEYNGKPLREYKFYVMGQIGVHKDYRGRGLVQMLYDKHREMYSSRYDFIITEIATRNTRSLRAHEKVGFKTIHHFTDETDDWDIVSWDWK